MARVLFNFNAHFCTCWYLSIVFQTILQFIPSYKMYTFKNETIYLFCKFKENPPIFILFIFHSNFHFLNLFFSNSFCCKCRSWAINLHINTTCQSITQHFTLYTINIVYCQGDMFQPLLGHLQALWENRSKSYLYFNALWDPKCLQIVLYDCKIYKFVYVVICVKV